MGNQKAKSAIVGRMPRAEGKKYKTLFIKCFDEDDAITCTQFPLHEEVIENIQKAVFVDCVPEYYLEGNDLVFDNISEISWEQKDAVVEIRIN